MKIISKNLQTPKGTDIRYYVIDEETGQILDDAQGYGYKSYENARKAYWYKRKNNFL